MEADMIMVNMQSRKSEMASYNWNTLVVAHWVKKNNLDSFLFSSPVKTLQRGDILNAF